jgi:hypothetical protein
MRHFQEANLLLPVRPLAGPSPHGVVWPPVRIPIMPAGHSD